MRAAIRRAEHADRRRIDVQSRIVGHLADQAAQVCAFHIDIGEIRLTE
jgi:hypothetical protein